MTQQDIREPHMRKDEGRPSQITCRDTAEVAAAIKAIPKGGN